ncbi:ApcC hetero-tetramer Cut9-Hcn1 [Gigaspora margarita]|uniref:ApcC hetero-tetramer Cut9-Hcn1 n=1 Tax=Gigaspora margarita TaxID=4874 RepID=A0A8H3WZV8_GIGMA|nr:ApcC hetero-tetramer Cut9-Hcn1 [Gigaspora margarita]
MEKYQEVLDILDDENPFLDREGGISVETSIFYLRGVAYSQQSELDNTKSGLKKCWKLMLNVLRKNMKKHNELHINVEEEIQEARSELENKFRLSNNADILLSHADELYTQCQFKECLEVTTKLLELDMYNQACLPIHIVCLYELREKNQLFLFAHELVEHSPGKAIMWFSIGCYNFLIIRTTKQEDILRGKTSTMNSHCGPVWFAYPDSFHWYATSSSQKSEEYLLTISQICESDPLVLNEVGVLYFKQLKYVQSVDSFKNAFNVAEKTKCV